MKISEVQNSSDTFPFTIEDISLMTICLPFLSENYSTYGTFA
jgi:hypothetical protein